MAPPLVLYFRPGACALAPHIVLHWLDADFDAVNAPRDESYKAINPSGAVPALKIGSDDILTQAAAIMQFLAEDAGRTDLLGGADPRARAEVARWTSFFTGDFHPAFFPVFAPGRYTTDRSDSAVADVKAAGTRLVEKGLEAIDARLDGRQRFAGEAPTIADAYATPMLRWAKRLFDDGLARWPATNAFYDKMADDPGVRAAMKTQGIDA